MIQASNKTLKFRNIFIVLMFPLLCNSCAPKLHIPTSFGMTTITLSNLFSNCHTSSTGSTVISFKGTVQIYWVRSANDRMNGDLYTFTSGANPANPVVVVAKIPNDGSAYQIEIVAQGTQCSLCAMTQYGPDNCIQAPSGGGTSAAMPQLDAKSSISAQFVPTITLSYLTNWQKGNVPNSCGCIVH